MSIDPHWIVKKTHELDGNPSDAHIDPEQFRQHQSAKMALHSPSERADYLSQLDRALAAEDGTSLRSKAELMQWRQEASAPMKCSFV